MKRLPTFVGHSPRVIPCSKTGGVVVGWPGERGGFAAPIQFVVGKRQ
jgi:hypothetical protein